MRSSQVLWKNNDDCSDIHHLSRHGHLLSFRVSSLEKTFLKNVIIIIIMVVVVVVFIIIIITIIIIIIIIIIIVVNIVIVVDIAIIIIVVVVVIFSIIVSKIIIVVIVVIIIFIYITGVRSVIYGVDFFMSRCLIGLPSLLTFTDFKPLKNVKKTLYLNLLSKIS